MGKKIITYGNTFTKSDWTLMLGDCHAHYTSDIVDARFYEVAETLSKYSGAKINDIVNQLRTDAEVIDLKESKDSKKIKTVLTKKLNKILGGNL